MQAEFLHPPHPDAVANLEIRYFRYHRPYLCDDSDSFMTETLACSSIMFIGAAQTAVCDFNQCFSWFHIAMARRLNDISRIGAFEDGEIDTHLAVG